MHKFGKFYLNILCNNIMCHATSMMLRKLYWCIIFKVYHHVPIVIVYVTITITFVAKGIFLAKTWRRKRKRKKTVHTFHCFKLLFKGIISVVQFYHHSLCTVDFKMVCHFNTAKHATVQIKEKG